MIFLNNNNNILGTAPIGSLIAKFSIPCVISLLINSLYNVVDQIFIGRGVGYLGNGATNVVFPLTVIALALALLIGDGSAAWLSLKLGEGKKEDASKGVCNGITVSFMAGILMLIVCLFFFEKLIYTFGCTDVIYPYAKDYGITIVIGLPFVIVSTAINSIIRADGSPKFAMISMLIGALINVVCDPIFIFVFDMGVFGAALATILGQIVSFLISIYYLKHFKSIIIKKNYFKIKLKMLKNVLSLGVSSFINQITIVIVMAVTNNMLKIYGANSVYGAEIPITAMGITMKVNQILISIIVGIAAGSQPIIGYNYGSGNFKRVKKTFGITVLLSTIITIIGFIIFQFFPMSIITIFGSEEGLYNEFAIKCFRIFLLLCVFAGFHTVAGIFTQAIGKPIKSTLISISRQIVLLVPLAIILPRFMGVEGVLTAGPFSDFIAFIFSFTLIVYEIKALKEDKKNV